MDTLENKVLVVTGAASGIGKALAIQGVERGMRVVMADLDEPALANSTRELAARGGQVIGQPVDVGDAASVERLAEVAYARFGAVHVLINNAGIASAESAWETSVEAYERLLRVNLFGVIHGARAFVPRMLRAAVPGHIVNVASAAGLFTVPGFAGYSASKAAVVAFTEALFHDLVARHAAIDVSLVCPSWVRTQLSAGASSQGDPHSIKVREVINQAIAQGMAADEVANAIFEAVLARRFYVLTHESSKKAVRARADDMLLDRPPTLFLRDVPAKKPS